MVTKIEATTMSGRGGTTHTYEKREEIHGTESFDTTRQVTLFDTTELHPHTVYLHIFNHETHASLVLDLTKKPDAMPELRATLDETPVDVAPLAEYGNGLKVTEGQTFSIWFGGETYEERDLNFGSARFTWVKP